jgi:hypothetical protein
VRFRNALCIQGVDFRIFIGRGFIKEHEPQPYKKISMKTTFQDQQGARITLGSWFP